MWLIKLVPLSVRSLLWVQYLAHFGTCIAGGHPAAPASPYPQSGQEMNVVVVGFVDAPFSRCTVQLLWEDGIQIHEAPRVFAANSYATFFCEDSRNRAPP